MVGRAKGRSMRASTTRLPTKRSRTITQAMSVPMTALTAATMSDATTVSSRADRASGVVTAVQNPDQPWPMPRHTTAASGMTTSRLR